MKTDFKFNYASRNRHKIKRQFWTFEAAWNLAATESKRKWGVENSSLYVATALCNQLKRDGHDVRKLILDAKNYLQNNHIVAPEPVHP